MLGTRKVILPLFVVLALLLGWLSAPPVIAQDDASAPDPQGVEAVIRAAYDALNAGDVEGNLAYYAQDVVSVSLPPPPGTTGVIVGYDDMLQVTKDLISRNIYMDITELYAHGDSASITALLTEDIFTDLGVAPMELTGTATVQDGLIVMESWVMRKESFARFMAAIAAAESKGLVQRLYDEVYSGQAPDALGELVAADVLDAYQTAITDLQAALPDLTVTVDDLLTEGDRVVAVVAFTGTPTDGDPVTWSQVDIHRVADGLLAEVLSVGGPPAAGE
ncbi:MAG: nuclear transport factor 2 family protein [Caldilinea sp.]